MIETTITWHDLRKNPDDLPAPYVWVLLWFVRKGYEPDCEFAYIRFDGEGWSNCADEALYWAEIPKCPVAE